MKLQERRRECGLEQTDLAKRVGTNAPMMSNFENYKCLPIPTMLEAICKELKCERQDIYKDNELYTKSKNRRSPKTKAELAIYKLTVSLPNEARRIFTQENLRKCGYHSLKDFIWHCYLHFQKKVEETEAKEKTTKQSNCSVVDEIGIQR